MTYEQWVQTRLTAHGFVVPTDGDWGRVSIGALKLSEAHGPDGFQRHRSGEYVHSLPIPAGMFGCLNSGISVMEFRLMENQTHRLPTGRGSSVQVLLTGRRVTAEFRDALFSAASRAGLTTTEYVLRAAGEKLQAMGVEVPGVFAAGDLEGLN